MQSWHISMHNLSWLTIYGSSRQEVFCEKGVLKVLQNSHENTGASVSFLTKLQAEAEACNFIEKETVAHMFSCEFCKFSKNTFLYRTPPVAASIFITYRYYSAQKKLWVSLESILRTWQLGKTQIQEQKWRNFWTCNSFFNSRAQYCILMIHT